MNCQRRARKLRLSLSIVTLLATYNQIFAAPLNRELMVHWAPVSKPSLIQNIQAGPKSARRPTLDPYPGKARLTFNKDGTFKVTVFSDLHFGENPWDSWGPQQDVNSTILMNTVLADEKPDYV
jgi:hypothetical protein